MTPSAGMTPRSKSPRTLDTVSGWKRALPHVWILLVLVSLALFFTGNIDDPYRLRGDYTGDPHAQTAGRHFFENGFASLYFLPIIAPGPMTKTTPFYTHYPPGPDLAAGLMHAIGWTSIQQQRRLPAFLFLLTTLVYYAVFLRWAPPAASAAVAALWAFTPAVLNLGDALHHYVYGELFRAIGIWGWLRWLDRSEDQFSRRVALAALFFATCFSFETPPFLMVFFASSAMLVKRVRPHIAVLYTLPCFAAFFLHMLQNSLALGWEDSVRDMGTAFLRRVLSHESGQTVGPGWSALWALMESKSRSMIGLTWVEAAILVPLIGVFLARKSDNRGAETGIALSLFFAGWVWFAAFSHHVSEHAVFDIRHMTPVIAIVIAAAFGRWLGSRPSGKLEVVVAVFLALVTIRMAATGVNFARKPTVALWGQELFLELGRVVPPDGIILSNVGVVDPLGHLAWRPVYPVSRPEDWDIARQRIETEVGAGRRITHFVYSVVGKTQDEVSQDPVYLSLKGHPNIFREPFFVFRLTDEGG